MDWGVAFTWDFHKTPDSLSCICCSHKYGTEWWWKLIFLCRKLHIIQIDTLGNKDPQNNLNDCYDSYSVRVWTVYDKEANIYTGKTIQWSQLSDDCLFTVTWVAFVYMDHKISDTKWHLHHHQNAITLQLHPSHHHKINTVIHAMELASSMSHSCHFPSALTSLPSMQSSLTLLSTLQLPYLDFAQPLQHSIFIGTQS